MFVGHPFNPDHPTGVSKDTLEHSLKDLEQRLVTKFTEHLASVGPVVLGRPAPGDVPPYGHDHNEGIDETATT